MASNLLVLYGSETGTSQDLAEQIWREGYRRNVPVKVVSFDEFDMNVSSDLNTELLNANFRRCRNKHL
jgi:sulfite reductase alpha subunit-like flavoprotein